MTTAQGTNYKNPVIAGFNPDPSICKVGSDYYLVTSTFEYFPGVPVYHSKDLVNWKLIGHALHRPSQLDLDSVASTAGIYAPTIRYHDGLFYMITTLVTRRGGTKPKGNFIVTAENPAGPWSDPHWIEGAEGIDPSLFFDEDGKAYYCGNGSPKEKVDRHHRHIWIQEIDLITFQLKGKRGYLDSKKYFENDIIGSPLAFEAPHLYKKDGAYYLVLAHGGTGMGHAVSIWKSDNPYGPWEDNPGNPILTHRGYASSGINATGHADIFQTQDGSWWSVFLAVRSTNKKQNVMGRETFLAPVDWSGTWPIYNPEGKVGRTAFSHKAPLYFKGKQQGFSFKDKFKKHQLQLAWNFIRTPRTNWWDLKAKKGQLKLQLRPGEIAQYEQPSFLGIRVPSMKIEAAIRLDFMPEKDKECAGLAFERGHDAEWTLVKEMKDGQMVVSAYHDSQTLLGQQILKSTKDIQLSIRLDDFKMAFYVKEKGANWTKIAETDANQLGFPPAGRFTGSMVGPYASSRGTTSALWAGFDDFELKDLSK
ncbi:MAG: glycoside hydrolase family 43 protein [Saprospiraceae bacterium]